MQPAISERRTWLIDERLASLIGCPIRVRAEAFTPRGWNSEIHPIDLRKLMLADGTQVDRDPIYAEGVLKEFVRRVGVVWMELDALPLDGTAEGRVLFRGCPAVILRGPATVQLHHSHFLERLPADEKSYWEHLSVVDPQMRLPLVD